MNAAGTVCGVGWPEGPPGTAEAFLWTRERGLVGLGDLPGGTAFYSWALGVNDKDEVVGHSIGPNQTEAFYWGAQTGMIGLGDLPGKNFSSVAADINNAGQICGVGVSQYGGEAAICTKSTPWQSLNTYPPTGTTWAKEAVAINEAGQITGFGFSLSLGMPEAYLWDSAHGVQGLGFLPGEVNYTVGLDLNDQGEVVGYAKIGELIGTQYSRAFVWDQKNGMRKLESLLDAASSATLPAELAHGINNKGWIVATTYGSKSYLYIPYIPGDANCDGKVNALDVKPFLSKLAKQLQPTHREEPWDDCGWWVGDVNQDGLFDKNDLAPFIRLILD